MASGIAAKLWARCRAAALRIENGLLGDFRLFVLILGLLFVAGALSVAVFAFFGGRDSAPLFGLAAAALAASGGAFSGLWATTARVVATREAAQGVLLAQIVQRYHSAEMSKAVGRVGRLGVTGSKLVALMSAKPGRGTAQSQKLMVAYPDVDGDVARRASLDADRRLLSSFFESLRRLCQSGFLPESTARNALGQEAAILYLDIVDPLNRGFREGDPVDGETATLSFFEAWVPSRAR